MTGLIMPFASLRRRSNPFSMQSYRQEGWTESKRNGRMEENKGDGADVSQEVDSFTLVALPLPGLAPNQHFPLSSFPSLA